MPNMTEQAVYDAVPFDIHDKLGKIRTDFTDDEINALPKAKRMVFFEFLGDYTGENAAVAESRDADRLLYAAVGERDEAEVALSKERQVSRIEELRRTIRARDRAIGLPVPPEFVDPKKEHAIKQAEYRLQEAELAVLEARLVADDKKRLVSMARAKVAESLKKWLAVHPPKSQRQAFDEHLASLARHSKPVIEQPVYRSHIDAVLSSGRSGSIDRGYGRPHTKRAMRVLPQR